MQCFIETENEENIKILLEGIIEKISLSYEFFYKQSGIFKLNN